MKIEIRESKKLEYPVYAVFYPTSPASIPKETLRPYSFMCYTTADLKTADVAPWPCIKLPLHVSGTSYAEKKENLRLLALDLLGLISDAQDLSYGEYDTINSFLHEEAEKYGLVEEFKADCVIY